MAAGKSRQYKKIIMKNLKFILAVVFVAVLAVNFSGCSKDNSSEIVGTWYFKEDPTDITTFNADGTGVSGSAGSEDRFKYTYNVMTCELSLLWDDGYYETYIVWIEGNTMYANNEEGQLEIYIRK